ncbi:unnamed protein product [Blepharisma stoltei]|uniref:Uncharacterized protein n=1 Tax=Blepharisma stoltei TaxID=1481888 RepID=A0AAU9J9U5_9CILI|nr:unnamed protein product [Blepharisma stoltei]
MGLATVIAGYFLIISSAIFFITTMTWIIGAKLLFGREENAILRWIQEDKYYCFLIPMIVPTTFILVYGNWLSMKFFRHN